MIMIGYQVFLMDSKNLYIGRLGNRKGSLQSAAEPYTLDTEWERISVLMNLRILVLVDFLHSETVK